MIVYVKALKIIKKVSLLTFFFCLINVSVFAADTTLPTGTITINNNAAKTNILTVTLNLSAKDASGVTEMRFSSDNVKWSAPEPYKTTNAWSISAGDGTKTAYVQYKDKAGNWSKVYSDTIILDSTPAVISNVRTANITATTVSILWDTDTPATSQVEYGLTASYGTKSAYVATLVKPHTINLAGLKEYTLYHYRVISKDDIANTATSSDYTFTTKDVTLPKGTITINSNAVYATTATVTLNLTATDAGSGVSQMQFSNDNKTWSNLEAFSVTKAWTVAAGDGTKTVYARFKDNAGNLSTVYSDAIILDTTPPSNGSIIIDKNAAKTTNGKVTLTLSAKDAVSGLSKMQFSNDNVTWTAWENYAASKAWTVASGNGTKTVYVKFQDNAGLISAAYNDTIILSIPAPAAPSIDKVTTPTKSNVQTITGKKSADTTEIIVTCPTAKVDVVKFPTTTTWICTLTALTEGTNTITVKAKNLSGVESSSVQAAIVLDTQGPLLEITSPKDGEVVR